MSRRTIWMSALLGALMISPMAMAQESQDRDRDRGERRDGDGERRGGDDGDRAARFREQFSNEMKNRLGATDEEWKVLQPKIEKVMTARRDTMGGGFGRGGFGRGGDRGGSDSNQQRSAVSQASEDLRRLLENKDAPADQIAAKLTALREAREKARQDLQTAQKELKEVLTARQEAQLVTMGMLE